MKKTVKILYDSGIKIVAGTDSPLGGFALHAELELYQEAGIPAPDLLCIATLGAARVMKEDEQLGSIAPGKLADLIIVRGNPTQRISDIRNVDTVIKEGIVYNPAEIERELGMAP